MKHTMCTANGITHLCEFVIRKSRSESPEAQAVHAAVLQHQGDLSALLEALLEVILTEDSNFMWSLSKPLLGLIIVNEAQFENLKLFAISRVTSNPQLQAQMSQLLDRLMEGVTRSLEAKNREFFGKKFTELRQGLASLSG